MPSDMDDLKTPLWRRGSNEGEEYVDKSMHGKPTTDYAKAGFLNKILFIWLNYVLKKGVSKTLGKDDVPLLCPEHRAAKLYDEFVANWPKKEEPNSTRRTLIKTFWKQFVLQTTVFGIARLSVLFVGPVLIQSFVQVTSGDASFAYEGYVLVLILFVAKTVEISSAHQFQFNCQKVGIQVRSSLISAVYRKGLRLSSHARQSHGVGQIVNYMSVDVQQMSDVVLQLNYIWLVPGQIIVALVILFYVTGVSAVAGLLVMLFSGSLIAMTSKKLEIYQKKVMRARDSRMLVTVEALNNMKIIKLQAWDEKFLKHVVNARASEYESLTTYVYTTACAIFILWLTPLAACVAIFTCIIFTGETITASMAFTTIATIRIVQEPLRVFPQVLIAISQARIALGRLDDLFWSDELKVEGIERLPFGSDPAVNVEGGTFKWGEDLEVPSLQDINLQVKQGSLVAIVGKVGSGKSSLLSALLGEMTKVSGKVQMSGSLAYVAQQAWIQSGTIQENILFGLPMIKSRYQQTLKQCALGTDLSQMEFGDQTEIGERGLNLSGGQKQRIQLARAVYQDSDIYLLDDIFSAVDAHTGSDIFRDCIVGALAKKTVLLVTHQIEFLPGADLILVMRDGNIVQSGHYEDLLGRGTDFDLLVEANNEAMEKVLPHEKIESQPSRTSSLNLMTSPYFEPRSPSISRTASTNLSRTTSKNLANLMNDETFLLPGSSPPPLSLSQAEMPNPGLLERHFSLSNRQWSTQDLKIVDEAEDEASARLTADEQRETGRVGFKVYWLYFTRSYGGALVVLLLIVQTVWQLLQVAGDYWVAYGTTPDEQGNAQTTKFVVIYGILALSCGISVFFRSLLVAFLGLNTAQSFYIGMLQSIFRAPMSFFDTTPTGRILSRASTDQAMTDVQIPMFFGGVLALGFLLLGVLVVTLQITWQIFIFLVPVGYAYYVYQGYYFATSRELTRVDALTKAPLIHHFSETIAGFVTIRCFQQEDRFIQINVDRIDSNLRMDFHNQASTEWVGMRMELIGILMLCASTLFLVALPKGFVDADLVGLCLTYGMNLNGCLFVFTWMVCQLENKMVAVERIGQYTQLPTEAALSIEKTRPAASWPHNGKIVLDNLKLRYRPQTPLVLKGISVTIKGGHKIGVVGRTGSGKSTLILALFRLVEAAQGRVLIDNIDISSLGLNDLRFRLSIIPQDPTLFDGTVRTNLDPLEEHTDPEIWEALEKCQLSRNVKLLEEKLDAPVLENGENWSLGQRQLFCLGRVLLKNSRILVLDEATASVDAQTDGVMQRIIRKEFEKSTVISIAHRIPTVMDSNRVVVLSAGKVEEYGSPSTLLDNPKSFFSSLVQEYSARSVSYSDLVNMETDKPQGQ